jgi:hypothetical protein
VASLPDRPAVSLTSAGGSSPYLSIVVTSRNDDHGGGLLGRMQIFVDGVIEQCKRHRLDAELIIVEWNPPADRPRLPEALRWPASLDPCQVRVIEVPAERHRWFRSADALPLFQMIAENVGIRRARGQFVLATNVDILFSDALMEFLAARRLEPHRMYRIDRHDVMAEVPADATLDEQLEYCRNHLLRIHTRDGSFSLEPDGQRALESADVAHPESGIRFGHGWFRPYRNEASEVLRGAGPTAELLVTTSDELPSGVLTMEVEPGPTCQGRTCELSIRDGKDTVLAGGRISGRQTIYLELPLVAPKQTHVFTISVQSQDVPWPDEPRTVRLSLLHCGWASRDEFERARRPPGWQNLRTPAAEDPSVEPFPPAPPATPTRGLALGVLGEPIVSPVFLHTNGCGDFTLLSRERWFDLRGYPELEIFSFHIDSLFCYSAHHGGAEETVLAQPMRIYHIEHGIGTGWTPEGQTALFQRVAEKGIPILGNDAVMALATQMRQLAAPMIFNGAEWGLAEAPLPDRTLHPGTMSSLAGVSSGSTYPAGSQTPARERIRGSPSPMASHD